MSDAFVTSLSYLSQKEKLRYFFYSSIQTLTNFLDLLGILCFSAASVLFIRGDNESSLLARFFPVKSLLSSQNLAMTLLVAGLSFLIVKTILSFVSTYGLFNLLGKFQTRLVRETFRKTQLLDQSTIQKLGSTNLSVTLVNGSESMALGILGASSIAFSEIFLLTILFLPLVIWAPVLACILLLSFGATSLALHRFLARWGTEVGITRFEEFNFARNLIVKAASLSKPLKVSGKIEYFSDQLNIRMKKASASSAKSYLLQQIPKYAFELTVILIGVASGIYFYSLGSIAKGAGTAVLLFGVSFRVLPSLLRLQSSIIFLRTSISEANSLRDLLGSIDQVRPELIRPIQIRNGNPPKIEISNLAFGYPGEDNLVFTNLNATIPAGNIAVIKGSSGSGKTTFIDLILGLKLPTSGRILFDGEVGLFPSQSYMAQDTILIDGTLEENIALGEKTTCVDKQRVLSIIEMLGIDEFVEEGPPAILGSHGVGLSGGQRQKIGLARSLYDNPLILVLDEPTSSLDRVASEFIARIIASQKGLMTIIIVSHGSDFDEISDLIISL